MIIGVFIFLIPNLYFAYFHKISGTDPNIPNGSIVFAPAFALESEIEKNPGPANIELAEWLANHSMKFSKILTQEAVIWAMQQRENDYKSNQNPNEISLAGYLNGVPVYRMHIHKDGSNVRTLEALSFAHARFGQHPPDKIVLLAHPKHFERAYRDLDYLYSGIIINACFKKESYPDQFCKSRIGWAFREISCARPIDFLHRTILKSYHPYLTLPSF